MQISQNSKSWEKILNVWHEKKVARTHTDDSVNTSLEVFNLEIHEGNALP